MNFPKAATAEQIHVKAGYRPLAIISSLLSFMLLSFVCRNEDAVVLVSLRAKPDFYTGTLKRSTLKH